MHRSATSALILIAFAASAVLGLCAMMESQTHDGLCAGTDMNTILCAANPLRVTGLTILLATIVSLFAVFAVQPHPIALTTPSIRNRNRSVLAWIPLVGLQPLFSDGILDARLYA